MSTLQIEEKTFYYVINKFSAYGLTLMAFLFFLIAIILPIEAKVSFPTWVNAENAIYFSLFIYMLIFFVKDLLLYFRIWLIYFIGSLIMFNISSAYFLVYIAIQEGGTVKIIIFIFMGLLYGAFIKDLFIMNELVKNRLPLYNERLMLLKQKAHNHLIEEDSDEFRNLGREYSNENTLFWKIAFILLLPFILLGKGASYVLVTSGASAIDSQSYMLASIGFLISLLLLIAFLPMLIVFLKLKYPKD